MYIQQADGNKCVWAFNFLFVSEGWLMEPKLLPSDDPKLNFFFFSCGCFAPSFFFLSLTGVLPQWCHEARFNHPKHLVKPASLFLVIMVLIAWKQTTSVLLNSDLLFCLRLFCKNRRPPCFVLLFSCVLPHPADGYRQEPRVLIEGWMLWMYVLWFRINNRVWHAKALLLISAHGGSLPVHSCIKNF